MVISEVRTSKSTPETSVKSQNSLVGAIKVVLDQFSNNVRCAGRRKGEPPYITATAMATIQVDPIINQGSVIHVTPYSKEQYTRRYRIVNPSLVMYDEGKDNLGEFKRLELSNKCNQIILFERK